MERFSKGTTDHDGDGRMGGSRKGRTMAKAAKKPTKAIEEQRNVMATAPDPQSGMSQVKAEKPTASAAKKALEQQFAEADAKADPAVAEASLSRAIRGY